MDDKQILIEIDIDTNKSLQNTRDLKIELAALKEAAKLAKEQSGALSDEYLAYEAAIKSTTSALRSEEKITKDVISAQTAVNGSIDQMRKQLSVVSAQWAKLSADERVNSEVGKSLSAQKLKLSEALIKEEKATGDARRNVGFYTKSIQEAIGGVSALHPALGTATNSVKAFNAALLANPITAVIALVIALTKAVGTFFVNSKEGQDSAAKFWGDYQIVLGNVKDKISEIGRAIASIFDKDLQGGGKKLGTPLAFLIETSVEILKNRELTKDKIKLAEEENKALIKNAQSSLSIAKLKNEAAKKDLYTNEQRTAMLNAIGQLEADQAAENARQADERLRIARIESTFSGTTNEDLRNLAELEADVFNKQQERFNKTKENEAKLSEIRKAQRAAQIAANNERIKQEEAALKLKLDQLARIEKAQNEARDREIKDFEDANNEIIESTASFIDDQAEIEATAVEAKLLNLDNEYELTKTHLFAKLDLERQMLIEKEKQEIAFAESIGASTTLIAEKYRDAQSELDQAEFDARLELAAGFAGNIAQIAGENTAIGKAAAIAETTINTYRSATAAYASLAGIPVVGPVLGAAAAGAAVAAGLANVKKIIGVKSGLPGDTGRGGASSGGGAPAIPIPVKATTVNPDLNQGIISRENYVNSQNNQSFSPVLIIDEVTQAQNFQTTKNKTAVI